MTEENIENIEAAVSLAEGKINPQSGTITPEKKFTYEAAGAGTSLAAVPAVEMNHTFEGASYPMLVVNGTGTVGSPIFNPASDKKVAIVIADFAWETPKPFFDHLNLDLRDERSAREEESIRRRKSVVTQNANLFDELAQAGQLIKIDAQGEQGKPITKTRSEMLGYAPEVKSQLIDDWLGNFHIERYFPQGEADIDALLTGNEGSIFFTVKIGNFKSPAHLLLFEFTVPSPDSRRNFEQVALQAGSRQEGEKIINTYYINHKAKLNFGQRYFKNVTGIVLSDMNQVEVAAEALYKFEDTPAMIAKFHKLFNPHWWVRLADELSDAFNFSGK